MHRPLILGHRGASARAPENTIAAFRRAADDGADGIETDLRFTADGVVVLLHDPVVDGAGPLSDITFADLRRSHPQIPTLDELLGALPDDGFILNLELKSNPNEPGYDPSRRMAAVVAEWVAAHQVGSRVVVSSFDRKMVDAVRRIDETITTGLLLEHGSVRRSQLLSIAADGHGWVLPHHSSLLFLPRRTIGSAHHAGLKVGTWTLDGRWRIARLRRAGLDAVITNDPGAVTGRPDTS